jgi:hypothetical protein
VPESASHYRVEAGDRTRIVPFDGRFWVEAATLQLRRLSIRTGELTVATGHCEADTSVDFAQVRVGAGEYLLPRQSVLETIRRDGAEARNVTTYSACREFAGDSVVRFDAPEEAPRENVSAATAAYPAGVRLTVALVDAIDMATAAAGDAVRVRVIKAAAPNGKREPALSLGTIVRGRLLRLAHHLDGEPAFSFSLAFETVESGRRTRPFAAVPDSPMVLTESHEVVRKTFDTIYRASSGRRAATRGGTFVFD